MTSNPLTPAVLHILLSLADEPQGKHGYAIAREVEELTDGLVRMGPGTLYGSLQRMQDAGLIEEAGKARRARTDDDERRRYYRITGHGRRAMDAERERFELERQLAHHPGGHIVAPGRCHPARRIAAPFMSSRESASAIA